MAESGRFDIPDMGSMNDGMHGSAIKDNEFTELYNWIIHGGKIKRRGGVKNSVGVPGPQSAVFNSLFLFSYAQNKAIVIIGADVGLFRLEPDTDLHLTDVKTLQSLQAFDSGTLTYPWFFAQVNGVGYAVRRGAGVRRFGRDFHSAAGIRPPTWAPVLSQGVLGDTSMGVGTFYGVATYRNSRTGAESNQGPVSNGLVKDHDTTRIDWAGMEPSPDSQVDQIRLWRTLVDQTDTYFLVDTIAVTDDTYLDGVTVDEIGGLISNENGLPPAGARSCCTWDDTLVIQDGTDVSVSEILMPESYASDTILNAYRDDGAEIRGVIGWGTKLVVGKTNKIHYFIKTAPRTYQRKTLDDRNGTTSQRSMKVIGSELWWFSGNSKNICRSQGYGSEYVINTELRKLLDRYVPGDPDTGVDELITAAVWPEKSLYLLSLPLDGAAYNTHTIAYNYRDNVCSVFDHESGHAPLDVTDPSILDPLGDDQIAGDMLAVFGDNRVYRYVNRDEGWGQDDYTLEGDLFSAAINARLKTKMFSRRGRLMTNKFVWMMTELDGDVRRANVELSAYLDGQSTAHVCKLFSFRSGPETSGLIDQYEPDDEGVPRPWKMFGLGTDDGASLIQIGVDYTDRPAVEISQMGIDVDVYDTVHKVAYGVPCGTVIPPRPDPDEAFAISNVVVGDVTVEEEIGTVTITWDTNLSSNQSVLYGIITVDENTENGPVIPDDVTHSITLTGLENLTTYKFVVVSYDSETDTTVQSAEDTFFVPET